MRFPFAISCEPRADLGERRERLPPPEAVLEMVGSLLPGSFRPSWIGGRVLRAHQNRFVMRVEVQSSGGGQRVYAVKVYADDVGAQVWAGCRALVERDPENRSGLCLPLLYLTHERALVFPWIEGATLNQIADGRKPELLRRAARQVAHLHRIPMAPGPPITPQMIVENTWERCEDLRERFPATAPIVEPLTEALRKTSALLDPARHAPVHGDLAGGHYLWTGARLLLLDLDMLGFNDAAYDVGHFLAQLERRALSGQVRPEDQLRWSACFRDAYLADMPEVSARNVSFYRGVTLVRKISTVCRHQPAEAPWLVPRIAERAHAALQEAASPRREG